MRLLLSILLLFHLLFQEVADGVTGCASSQQKLLCCVKKTEIFPLDIPTYSLLCFLRGLGLLI